MNMHERELKELRKYPEEASAYPSGYSSDYEVNMALLTTQGFTEEDARRATIDLINQNHFDEVARAFKVISQDVNGNRGQGLARVFADEHPYLQNEMFRALSRGMALRHPSLNTDKSYVEIMEELDGRISKDVADFVNRRF